jgi:hypothetical protein
MIFRRLKQKRNLLMNMSDSSIMLRIMNSADPAVRCSGLILFI